MRRFPKKVVLGSAVALFAALAVLTVPGLYTEARWFGQLGQGAVFWKGLSASWTTGLVVGVLTGGLILLSVETAIRRAARIGWSALGPVWTPVQWTARVLSGVAGLLMGVAAAAGWLELQLFWPRSRSGAWIRASGVTSPSTCSSCRPCTWSARSSWRRWSPRAWAPRSST